MVRIPPLKHDTERAVLTQFSFIFGVVSDANGTFSAEDVGPLEAGVGTGCSDAGTLQRFGCFFVLM